MGLSIPAWAAGSSVEASARGAANRPADTVEQGRSAVNRGLIAVVVAFGGLVAINLWLSVR